jgi:DNA-directed RNA polymerase subunit RPC12/RpoP
MSPRWRKPLPPPLVAEGQVEAFDSDALTPPEPSEETVYICRECYSRRIVGPINRTVDPRWVSAVCLDCGERVIANVRIIPIPKEQPE